MEKLKALQNFNLWEEKLKVKENDEIFIGDVKKTVVDEKGNITVNEERAKQIEKATYENKPLAKRIVVEEKPIIEKPQEIETADLKVEKETADVKKVRVKKGIEKE